MVIIIKHCVKVIFVREKIETLLKIHWVSDWLTNTNSNTNSNILHSNSTQTINNNNNNTINNNNFDISIAPCLELAQSASQVNVTTSEQRYNNNSLCLNQSYIYNDIDHFIKSTQHLPFYFTTERLCIVADWSTTA